MVSYVDKLQEVMLYYAINIHKKCE